MIFNRKTQRLLSLFGNWQQLSKIKLAHYAADSSRKPQKWQGFYFVKLFAVSLTVIFIIGLIGCSAAEGPDSTSELVAAASTATATAVPTEPATLPPAIVVELPSRTPIPATDTPIPTDTPTAVPVTDTPTAIPPTNTAVYVAPPPTAIPPTNTAVPPTAAPQIGANGLVASHFALQDRSSFTVNGAVWFEYKVSNSTGGNVPYNALGVMPKKDGRDRFDWYQQTYGGPNSTIKPGGLEWASNIDLPEAGNYTLRLVICFDGFDTCLKGNGTWHTLSSEIPITIN